MPNKDGKGPDTNCPTSGKKKKERQDGCPGTCGKDGCCHPEEKKDEEKEKE